MFVVEHFLLFLFGEAVITASTYLVEDTVYFVLLFFFFAL